MRSAPTFTAVVLIGFLLAYQFTTNPFLPDTEKQLNHKWQEKGTIPQSKFEEIWPTLQDKLCPNYDPRYQLGSRLFMAARREMNITDWKLEGGNEEWFYYGYFIEPAIFYGHSRNKKASFEYVRIWKAANSQILLWLEKNFHKANAADITSSNSTPCYFTAIRDPISHFLSGYNEVETRSNNGKWWVSDEVKKLSYMKKGRQSVGSTERFNMYVHDLLTASNFHPWWLHMHTNSMSRILPILKNEGKKLDGYLSSIENITSTLLPFINTTCPGILNSTEAHSKMEVMGQHTSSKDPFNTYAAAKNVWKENGPTARALCALHAMDYACWRDLPDGVPQLCQDVYSSDMFLDTVKFSELIGMD